MANQLGVSITIGQAVPSLESELDDLYDAAPDASTRAKISMLHDRLQGLLTPLIDSSISQADAAYGPAVTGVEGATKAVKAATGDLAKLADAISKVAEAVTLIDKLLGILKP
jgi:hypothetical protein